MTEKEMIKEIFKEIDEAIEKYRSDIPIKIKDSRFLKKYIEIKKRYLK